MLPKQRLIDDWTAGAGREKSELSCQFPKYALASLWSTSLSLVFPAKRQKARLGVSPPHTSISQTKLNSELKQKCDDDIFGKIQNLKKRTKGKPHTHTYTPSYDMI
jgi:hypothetical protein